MPQFTEIRRPALWEGRGVGVRPVRRRTVVLGYDGSEPARSGLPRAVEEAGAGGRILVITSIPSSAGADLDGDGAFGDEPVRLLEEARAFLRHHDVEVATRLEEGDPAEVLASAAREAAADLIVVGARGRDFLARALRGSVAERLVTLAPCALLVVR